MIQFINENVKMPSFHKNMIKKWIKFIAEKYDKEAGDISYIFCNDERMLEVNRQYLQHDYYTDVITFDYSTDKTISGDIFIGLETVESNAKELGVNPSDELHRILIHGILHLCGQGDKTPESKMEMTRKEDDALEHLKLGDF